jgi:lysophospholipase L1-like esterase
VETFGNRYLRFAALGDSFTYGLGDPVAGGWRGWARLLADAMTDSAYDVSLCNLAIPGATASSVLTEQLADAVAHRPDLAALVVGVNDVLKSTWDPFQVRDDLLVCAEALTGAGAVLMTARFHDHSQVLPLPAALRRPLRRRIGELNAAWDDVHATFGGLRIDLTLRPEPLDRRFWSIDRIHPSELGHRCLARAFAAELGTVGLGVEPPAAECSGGLPPSWRRDVGWLVAEGAPWVGRRARDLGPWAAKLAMREFRPAAAPAADPGSPRSRPGQCAPS